FGEARAQSTDPQTFEPPAVFQAAGPTTASIQASLDADGLARGGSTTRIARRVPARAGWRQQRYREGPDRDRPPRDQLGRRRFGNDARGNTAHPVPGLTPHAGAPPSQ